MKTMLKGVVSYQRESQAMDFYLVQNVGHDLYFFKSPYHTDIIMIYVETLQKDFNQWTLHFIKIDGKKIIWN